MRRIICWIKAIPLWIKCREFVPHIYRSEYEKATIIATENSFRVSEGYQHEPGEVVYKDACLIRNKCIHCGKEELSWYSDWSTRDRIM